MSKKPKMMMTKEEMKEMKGGKYMGGPKEEKKEKGKKGFVPFKKKR